MDEIDVRELQAHLRTLHRRLRQSVPPVAGVSRSAARVLGAVARAGAEAGDAGEAGAQPGRIADELVMTTSNVAGALRELDDAGYVARRPAASDGRRTVVVLTDAGAQAVAAHRALRVDGLREWVEAALTPDEQARLAAVVPLLGKIAAAGEAGTLS